MTGPWTIIGWLLVVLLAAGLVVIPIAFVLVIRQRLRAVRRMAQWVDDRRSGVRQGWRRGRP